MGTAWTQQRSREEWSHRKTVMGWGLLSVLLLGLTVVFSVLLFYTFYSCGPRPCERPVCLALMANYLMTGNASALPCIDFFSFVCGNLTSGWANESRNVLEILKEENEHRLQRMLEASVSWPPDSAEEKTVRFYKACMDTDAIEVSGAEPLLQVIEELGGWRISGNWTPPDFNHTLKLLMSQYGSFPFFKAYLGPQPSPPHTPVIQIEEPEFQMPFRPDQKNYTQILRAYVSYLEQLGTLLGGDQKVVLEHAYLSITITSNLLMVANPLVQEKTEDKLIQETTIAQLQEMAPSIDWLSCLQAVFSVMTLSPSQPIIVHDLDYIKGMSQVIEQKANYRDYLQSHMILGLVSTLIPALDSHFQNAQRNLSQKLQELAGWSPISLSIPRWKKCIKETETFFKPTLGAMFVQETFSRDSQDVATQLFSEIQNAMSRHLKRLHWMDEGSQREVQIKLSQLKVEMGAPEEILKPDPTKQDYQDINFGSSYLQTVLSCSRSLHERTMRGFLGPPYRHRWKVFPWDVKAYYSMPDNVAVFPAGLLQPPFFHPSYPSSVNFGAAGSVMARELMHIFNQYLVPEGCPACDIPTLNGELLCLQKHYESISLPTGNIFNSSHTLLENAADIGALVIAMQAYKKWLQKHKGETILPSLGLSPYQLFYQSYAKVMCGSPASKDAQDLHSPPIVRIHGPLSNIPTFARHFHCPRGTPMNPSNRCQLWLSA
ncbi:kell blood group glycoprotein isoform X2 [Monodelphis domestica]|uniref:kell blood group glycoprotein isoform X2 n=1 Tax=Monodelphis domestica TaxID=13616 RepID=UPI0024E1D704|nr:kell blood group glycoprotein isoform X2 [Monodelphis domestica]